MTKLMLSTLCCAWGISSLLLAADPLFEDKFDDGLSSKWQLVGMTKEDFRIRNGALELRVHPGKLNRETPMLKVILPFDSSDSLSASVEVTIIDPFTEPEEMAGLFLLDEDGWDFRATKQRIHGELFYSPPRVNFLGKPGGESDLSNYAYTFRPAADKAGPLRILINQHYAYFQVGPSKDGKKYMNFFFSAISQDAKERGFCLCAAGAPKDVVHWVRFDNFRVAAN